MLVSDINTVIQQFHTSPVLITTSALLNPHDLFCHPPLTSFLVTISLLSMVKSLLLGFPLSLFFPFAHFFYCSLIPHMSEII